jgi:hypothetical protein
MPDQYIARYTKHGLLAPIKTQPYPSRDEAARALFRLCLKAKSCSTSRATMIGGELSDLGGWDIQFHDRYNYPN